MHPLSAHLRGVCHRPCYNKTSITCLTNLSRNWRRVPWRASLPPIRRRLSKRRVWRPWAAKGRSARLARARANSHPMRAKVSPEERKRSCMLLKHAEQRIEAALGARKQEFDAIALRARLDAEWVDVTLPAPGPRRGHLHPITRIQRELEDLFVSLGFAVLDGPEVETEYYNFDALNIPRDHPARDMQDTFWLDGGNLLRTHTSPVQVRGIERLGPPLRMIAPGRVFRNESVDASHEHTFYQIEGMMIDRDVSHEHTFYQIEG